MLKWDINLRHILVHQNVLKRLAILLKERVQIGITFLPSNQLKEKDIIGV
tara:strand:+ start:3177 stop:3326 length:150 start_codon:yes stop_codon:yes gene_type:complete